jgi:Trk-type K+ transport system membrane component
MFIGGSSGSTAGGIKTSTISVLLVSAYSNIRGLTSFETLNRSIPKDSMSRAFSIFFFAVSSILLFIFLLSITEREMLHGGQYDIMDLIFEEVSAFSTVGLSTGLTGLLSSQGKIIIILSMFIGRVGTITIGIALLERRKKSKHELPPAKILIG